ncbi:MAG TPA: M28 family peptidase [Kofleriaceae bacterium]|nr:M28 family peptidase [Kofleriaceae bacterium]
MMTTRITELVAALCSPACAGRRPGTPGGRAGRRHVAEALRAAGCDPFEQPVRGCGGANVLALVPGTLDRWIVVGAHHDHLGQLGGETYRGADDNAAAVAVLVEVGRALAGERHGRGVILAAFDGEEPPYFTTGAMGSQAFVAAPPVPREAIDFMVCMDLVGHRLGPPEVPDAVGDTLFALGAERSAGTLDLVRSLRAAEPGVVVRAADADIIPPLSDYEPFWRARIPFLFLSAGRSRVYHTPDDVPELLDVPKLAATARWLTGFVRALRVRDTRLAWHDGGSADAATLDEAADLLGLLAPLAHEAGAALRQVHALRGACDRSGRLPGTHRHQLGALLAALEARLA